MWLGPACALRVRRVGPEPPRRNQGHSPFQSRNRGHSPFQSRNRGHSPFHRCQSTLPQAALQRSRNGECPHFGSIRSQSRLLVFDLWAPTCVGVTRGAATRCRRGLRLPLPPTYAPRNCWGEMPYFCSRRPRSRRSLLAMRAARATLPCVSCMSLPRNSRSNFSTIRALASA